MHNYYAKYAKIIDICKQLGKNIVEEGGLGGGWRGAEGKDFEEGSGGEGVLGKADWVCRISLGVKHL